MSQHVQYQDPETAAAKWDVAIIHFIICTCAFPSVTCQNVCSEIGLLVQKFTLIYNNWHVYAIGRILTLRAGDTIANMLIKVQLLTRRCPGPRSRWRGAAGSAWVQWRWSLPPERCRTGPPPHSSCWTVRTTSTVCRGPKTHTHTHTHTH